MLAPCVSIANDLLKLRSTALQQHVFSHDDRCMLRLDFLGLGSTLVLAERVEGDMQNLLNKDKVMVSIYNIYTMEKILVKLKC